MTALVLLAEKDPVLRAQCAEALRRHGYRVIPVGDGLGLSDALETARLSRGRGAVPDVIVADAELDGYSGAQICALLSRDEPKVPFILLGGAACAGAALLLDKPVDPNAVVRAVAAGLLSRAFAPEADGFADEITAPG